MELPRPSDYITAGKHLPINGRSAALKQESTKAPLRSRAVSDHGADSYLQINLINLYHNL